MQESYGEGLATHTGPESCVGARKGVGEALTGERTDRVFSRETKILRDADAVEVSGRPHPGRRHRETRRSPARSETPCMSGHTSRENRESPWSPVVDGTAGRVGKSKDLRR
jgi:RNA-directed DNA polymerase